MRTSIERKATRNSLISHATALSASIGVTAPRRAGPRFLLLHRRRVWNESERRWIGWERKRGKLHELNRLLRGATDTTFMDMGGAAPSPPQDVRYVVTLDSDTRLPRDTVRRLIGKMAHPLNRPRLDAERGAIVEGYGVLQPRVTPSLPIGGEGSLFQRVFSSSSGIDPYAAAVSDVYQDMFCEGSYAGKGIYDVDAFEGALSGRTPDSTLLSHDLFEGTFARAGFASDVEVVDDFPSRYDVSARRHHRWARGDWQLLPWILGFAAERRQKRGVRDALPRIGRWKMIDNLRRTVSAPACLLALAAGWMLPLGPALVWTTFALATIILPSLIPVISAIPGRRPGVALSGHLRALREDLRLAVTLSALNITFLADQAWSMGDAIARTLWRLFVSRRHLLEWTPAAQASAAKRLDLQGFAVRMSGAFVLAAAALLLTLLFGHGGWPIADTVRRAVADFARCSALRQPVSARRCGREDFGGPNADPASDRAPDLAVLRNVRDAGRQYAASGQLPGRPHLRGRPSNLADQHRIVSAFRRLRARLRLDRDGPDHRSAGSDPCDDGSHAALSRPFLQLVRHPRSQGARAEICLLRRQRQSGRTSHRDRQRLQRVAAIADDRRVASGRNRRRPRSDRRTRRPPACRSPDSDGDAAPVR